ncbi:MAG: gamma-glutamyltransferase [Phycisphaerales bacterium]
MLVSCQSSQVVRPKMDRVDTARANHGMVVSVTKQSSRVGREVLQEGGNAVDAAVATAFALAVTWPEAGNIGGGGFMMIAPAEDAPPVCIDYRETAPGAATENMYYNETTRHNYLASGVPGTIAGLALAHDKYGSLPWKDLVEPAVKLARDGYTIDKWQAYSMNLVLDDVRQNPSKLTTNLLAAYGKPDGERWKPGDRVKLPDLADTLQQIANEGPDAFYKGAIADKLVSDMRRFGGIISKDDLAGYKAIIREPIHGTFNGYDVYAPPPPSSGGVTLILALNILENLQLDPADRYVSLNTHKIVEAMRRAFRDRAAYLGDPDFVDVPSNLTENDYAKELASTIDLKHASRSEELLGGIRFTRTGVDTTHFSVIDNDGMAVSNTYTLEQSWGSRMVVTGAGFILNNEMGDFNWVRGGTNDQGRVGTEPNLIEPGKRMLSSQCPVILKRDGEVVLVTGSPGGRTIINTVLNVVLNYTRFGMPLDKAVDAPRIHHQWFPDEVRYEALNDPHHAAAVAELRGMGHDLVEPSTPQGSAHSIAVLQDGKRYLGVADKRRGGAAEGY